jgi:hypothetical protein
VQDVEQQRFDKGWIRPHGIEVEDLQAVEGQRVVNVVEEFRVSAFQFRPQRSGAVIVTVLRGGDERRLDLPDFVAAFHHGD